MTEDARFEDGAESPLTLIAADRDDLAILSSLTQDAVFPITEVRWLPKARRFALLVNRFRWEDTAGVEGRHKPERVRALLIVDDVLHVASQGIDRGDTDTILSLLMLEFTETGDGAGRLTLMLAGDGAIALDVECVNVTLRDVTRPYLAPSGDVPRHPLD